MCGRLVSTHIEKGLRFDGGVDWARVKVIQEASQQP